MTATLRNKQPFRAPGAAGENLSLEGMVFVPGGTFRMGSDRHYPEEAPAHRVTVDALWIDRTPVTNRKFRQFVNATGHVTFAEIKPDAKDYPGALPHMLKAGSLVFTPLDHPVDLRDFSNWWTFKFGANSAAGHLPPLRHRAGTSASHPVGTPAKNVRSSARIVSLTPAADLRPIWSRI